MKFNNLTIAQTQYYSLLRTYLLISDDWCESQSFNQHINANSKFIERYYSEFCKRNFGYELAYSKSGIDYKPHLEEILRDHISSEKNLNTFKYREASPTLCLSHDIDYLKPTFQMKLKRLLHDKKTTKHYSENYLKSIENIFELDSEYSREKNSITAFVASVSHVKPLLIKLKQWLLDPSYTLNDELFDELLSLVMKNGICLGIHGSFFSISEDLLIDELKNLESKLNSRVTLGRQHWLRMPEKSLNVILDAGIKIDSSIAWNNTVGFRGGFARPYPIVLSNNSYIWELPLVIMDGALFGPLNCNKEDAIKISSHLIEEVKARQGCISLDWHERSAAEEYNWFETYEKILSYSFNRGFKFKSFQNEFTNISIL